MPQKENTAAAMIYRPLNNACFGGNTECVKLILEAGVSHKTMHNVAYTLKGTDAACAHIVQMHLLAEKDKEEDKTPPASSSPPIPYAVAATRDFSSPN